MERSGKNAWIERGLFVFSGGDIMQTEIWKPVRGYEGLYEVSNLGGVKSHNTKKQMGVSKNKYGHLKVGFWKNGKNKLFLIHRLVYQTFVGEIPSGYDIHHVDGNPRNNNVSNLQAIDHRKHISNHMMGRQHTLGKKRSKEAIESHRAKVSKPVAQYTLDDVLIKTYPSTKEAERQTGIDSGSISRCCNGVLHKSGGYH